MRMLPVMVMDPQVRLTHAEMEQASELLKQIALGQVAYAVLPEGCRLEMVKVPSTVEELNEAAAQAEALVQTREQLIERLPQGTRLIELD